MSALCSITYGRPVLESCSTALRSRLMWHADMRSMPWMAVRGHVSRRHALKKDDDGGTDRCDGRTGALHADDQADELHGDLLLEVHDGGVVLARLRGADQHASGSGGSNISVSAATRLEACERVAVDRRHVFGCRLAVALCARVSASAGGDEKGVGRALLEWGWRAVRVLAAVVGAREVVYEDAEQLAAGGRDRLHAACNDHASTGRKVVRVQRHEGLRLLRSEARSKNRSLARARLAKQGETEERLRKRQRCAFQTNHQRTHAV